MLTSFYRFENKSITVVFDVTLYIHVYYSITPTTI